MITRLINWIATTKPGHEPQIMDLEARLFNFYSNNPDYYGNIDFTGGNWNDSTEIGYVEIVKSAQAHDAICEVGCGNANLLRHYPHLASKYSGCDFSQLLLDKNHLAFPEASFAKIDQPNSLPFADESFDFVFSVFVLEHSTHPSKLLDECSRILKKGGTLIILCPDFMGQGKMTSQRAGWSSGTASQKLRRGKLMDALITLYDNRIRIPLHCRRLAKESGKDPLFMVNLSPVVFEDKFIPDVDAVYITNRAEIKTYLSDRFVIKRNSTAAEDYEQKKNLIFLILKKM